MKKIKLSPLQNRIMWILQEAGEETWQTVLATLRADGFTEEVEVHTALDGLQRARFITQNDDALTLTDHGHAQFT